MSSSFVFLSSRFKYNFDENVLYDIDTFEEIDFDALDPESMDCSERVARFLLEHRGCETAKPPVKPRSKPEPEAPKEDPLTEHKVASLLNTSVQAAVVPMKQMAEKTKENVDMTKAKVDRTMEHLLNVVARLEKLDHRAATAQSAHAEIKQGVADTAQGLLKVVETLGNVDSRTSASVSVYSEINQTVSQLLALSQKQHLEQTRRELEDLVGRVFQQSANESSFIGATPTKSNGSPVRQPAQTSTPAPQQPAQTSTPAAPQQPTFRPPGPTTSNGSPQTQTRQATPQATQATPATPASQATPSQSSPSRPVTSQASLKRPAETQQTGTVKRPPAGTKILALVTESFPNRNGFILENGEQWNHKDKAVPQVMMNDYLYLRSTGDFKMYQALYNDRPEMDEAAVNRFKHSVLVNSFVKEQPAQSGIDIVSKLRRRVGNTQPTVPLIKKGEKIVLNINPDRYNATKYCNVNFDAGGTWQPLQLQKDAHFIMAQTFEASGRSEKGALIGSDVNVSPYKNVERLEFSNGTFKRLDYDATNTASQHMRLSFFGTIKLVRTPLLDMSIKQSRPKDWEVISRDD